MPLSEADTRAKLIDPAIHARGWTEDLICREETAGTIDIIDSRPKRRSKGRIDYTLRVKVHPDNQPVAVALIEAKREELPPNHGLEQAKAYAKCKLHNVPFVFSSNGHLFVEYDSFTGLTSTPRQLTEFPTPAGLRARYEQKMGFSLEAPPAPEFFRDAFMVCDGRWRSQFPPGHILALAAFDRVGLLEWLAPVAAGVIAALFFSLGVRLYGGHVAVLSTVLLVASPFFVLQFSEAMNHTTTLAWFMAFLWAYDRGARDGSMRWGALAGFSAGAMIATRPLTAACLIGAWTLWDVVRFVVQWRNRDTRRRFIRLWGGATLGGLAPIAFLLYFNDVTNGSLFLFGYIAKQGASHLLGFDAWVGNGHTPAIGLTQGLNNVQSLGVDFLHGWPVYGFVFIAALLLIGRPTALDARMMTTAFALSLGYFFYWYQDSMFGPRFLFEALPLYIWLSTRGIEECARLTSRVARVSPSSAWRSISVLVVLLALFSFRQTHARLSHEAVRNEGFRDKVMEAVDSALSRPNAAIFVGARRSSLAYVRNFDGKEPRVLYDLGDEANARYMRARPDLEFWLYRVNELRCLTPDD